MTSGLVMRKGRCFDEWVSREVSAAGSVALEVLEWFADIVIVHSRIPEKRVGTVCLWLRVVDR